VTVDYRHNDRPQTAVLNLYAGIEKAKAYADDGQPVRLLVDPDDTGRLLCIDTLIFTG